MNKLSVAIADRDADEKAFVVWRGFEESMAKAKDLGYDGVELALRTKEEIDVPRLRRLLDQKDLEVSAISTGQVFSALNLYLTNPDVQQRKKAVAVITGLVELAGEFGKLVNLGRARGFIAQNQSPAEAQSLFLQSLEEIAQAAERRGVGIIIEPVNRYEINFINTVAQCGELLQQIQAKNVGIMPDVFHMNIEDAKIGESLESYAASIHYIHLADSNRHAPGDGHLDFDDVFSALARTRYKGWLTVEILPLPSPNEAAKRAVTFLRPMMQKYLGK